MSAIGPPFGFWRDRPAWRPGRDAVDCLLARAAERLDDAGEIQAAALVDAIRPLRDDPEALAAALNALVAVVGLRPDDPAPSIFKRIFGKWRRDHGQS